MNNHSVKQLKISDRVILNKIIRFQEQHAEHQAYSLIYRKTTLRIRDPNNKIFYATDSASDELTGFIDVSIEGNDLVLDNMVTYCRFTDSGLIRQLLSGAFKIISEQVKIQLFRINVFEKNKRLLNLLLAMGMRITSYNYWYDITNYCLMNINGPRYKRKFNKWSFRVSPGQSGSLSVHYKGQPIGRIVDDKCLIIQSDINFLLFEKINFFFKDSALRSVCLISKKELELMLIDRSFYLSVPLNEPKAANLFVLE